MTNNNLDIVDKLAMGIGGGLIILAIPVMGFLTTITGSMSAFYTYTVMEGGEAVTKTGVGPAIPAGAEIVNAPLFAPNLRATLVLLGLVVFALYGAYKAFNTTDATTEHRTTIPAEE